MYVAKHTPLLENIPMRVASELFKYLSTVIAFGLASQLKKKEEISYIKVVKNFCKAIFIFSI